MIVRLQSQERAQLSEIENLYVFSSQNPTRLPLRAISSVENKMETERIRRQEHFRNIGVHAFPRPGVLASEVLKEVTPQLNAFETNLPPGYHMIIVKWERRHDD